MIKRLVVGLLLLIVLGLIGLNSIGVTPAFIVYGPGVASGMGAKLLCSAEYVIGSERDQAFVDFFSIPRFFHKFQYATTKQRER